MEFERTAKLLRQIPASRNQARTVREIATRYFGGTPEAKEIRTIQRWVADLSTMTDPPLLEETGDQPSRYFLRLDQVVRWFLTEEIGLQVLLSRPILNRALTKIGGINSEDWLDAAEKVVGSAWASNDGLRLRRKLRSVPDGIGRLPALIKPEVINAIATAIKKDVRVRLDYVSSKGSERTHVLTILGLVAKDGTIYLIGSKQITDTPRHYALHRINSAAPTDAPGHSPGDFDLDEYIDSTHLLSHALDPNDAPIHLRLAVANEALYHFRERPLSVNQTISEGPTPDWHEVGAEIPNTVLLVPFLLSMGPWIKVLAPDNVKAEMAKRVAAMAANY